MIFSLRNLIKLKAMNQLDLSNRKLDYDHETPLLQSVLHRYPAATSLPITFMQGGCCYDR
jgi:hypothetical protein